MIAFERRMEGDSGSLSINKDGGKLYASQGIYDEGREFSDAKSV